MKKNLAILTGTIIVGISIIVYLTSFAKGDDPISKRTRLNEKAFSTTNLIWQKAIAVNKKVVNEVLLNVPLLNQMDPPILFNGCEVTSLAMMLNFKGINVTKNQLANRVIKVPLIYSSGEYGNPNVGFVGNMEIGPGLGVYHRPIFNLAKKYVGDQVEDLTGQPFELLLAHLANGNPIWVITTTTFTPISELETWDTPQGLVHITFKMHSVVITGFDEENIYINNPYGMKNQKVNRVSFIASWEQMGKQAIVIY